jgi:hypothetical protein
MKALLGCAALVMVTMSPALASHANPWATDEDVVLAKNHDENQVRSIDTPGEDEMRGKMTRSANGKTGDASVSGSSDLSKGSRNGRK